MLALSRQLKVIDAFRREPPLGTSEASLRSVSGTMQTEKNIFPHSLYSFLSFHLKKISFDSLRFDTFALDFSLQKSFISCGMYCGNS